MTLNWFGVLCVLVTLIKIRPNLLIYIFNKARRKDISWWVSPRSFLCWRMTAEEHLTSVSHVSCQCTNVKKFKVRVNTSSPVTYISGTSNRVPGYRLTRYATFVDSTLFETLIKFNIKNTALVAQKAGSDLRRSVRWYFQDLGPPAGGFLVYWLDEKCICLEFVGTVLNVADVRVRNAKHAQLCFCLCVSVTNAAKHCEQIIFSSSTSPVKQFRFLSLS